MTTSAAAPLPVTDDALLGGRVKLLQPLAGYRVAIDPVLLAAAVPTTGTDTVLDLGCGVGAAALCLAVRVPGCRVTGIEAQRDLVRLAGENAARNGVADRVTIMAGDISHPPPRLEPGSFAHVMANPPYMEAVAASPSPVPGKSTATVEGAADLAVWVRFALVMVRPRGSVTFIHRADRIEQLLAQLAGRAGEIAVLPLWPGAGKPAKRVIVQARKDVATPTRLLPGLVLHEADGRFTAAADAVLRDAAALMLD
ncbi:MAG: methyltransferase [Alphaproteobacteria bacterium]|nr:methyltransferase [Alphaproteobacteria bacterium]